MARSGAVWYGGNEVLVHSHMDNVQQSIGGLLANAENLNQVCHDRIFIASSLFSTLLQEWLSMNGLVHLAIPALLAHCRWPITLNTRTVRMQVTEHP